jgi:hypothetical protein
VKHVGAVENVNVVTAVCKFAFGVCVSVLISRFVSLVRKASEWIALVSRRTIPCKKKQKTCKLLGCMISSVIATRCVVHSGR